MAKRYSYHRAIKWLSIYFLLALVPMVIALAGNAQDFRSFWIELGVAFGLIGLAMMGLQVIFSGRFAQIAPSYGMDNITQFHREMGIIAFLFVLAHPLTMITADRNFIRFLDPRDELLRAIALNSALLALLGILVSSLWRESLRLGYEHWRLLHDFLALSLIFLGTVHAIQAAHYFDPLWKKIVLAGVMGACMWLTLHIRLGRPWRNRSRPYRVQSVKPEADDCYSLTLAPEAGERLSFKPGQLAWLTLNSTPFTLQQHPFSIASSARDPCITFTAKAVGDFTSSIKDVPPGTSAFLEGPFGSFVPQPDSHLFLIMGGIGVTPAMSMLRTMRDDHDSRQAVLIYGSSTWENITFRDELEQLSREINLKVVHVLSEPHDDWEGESGYVTEEMLKKFLPTEPHRSMYFICGPEPLMDAAEVALRNLGIDWRRIYTERFDLV